jgi:hypothetical protein
VRGHHIRSVTLAIIAAIGVSTVALPASAQSATGCTAGSGIAIKTLLVGETGTPLPHSSPEVVLVLRAGGLAEYRANGLCTVLTFTGIRNGDAVYTDDGLGRGLTVMVSKDRTLTVVHAAGWTGKSE